jgi:hypothetical protein
MTIKTRDFFFKREQSLCGKMKGKKYKMIKEDQPGTIDRIHRKIGGKSRVQSSDSEPKKIQ